MALRIKMITERRNTASWSNSCWKGPLVQLPAQSKAGFKVRSGYSGPVSNPVPRTSKDGGSITSLGPVPVLCHLHTEHFFSYHFCQISLAPTCNWCLSSSSFFSTEDSKSIPPSPPVVFSPGWSNPPLSDFTAVRSHRWPETNFLSTRTPRLFCQCCSPARCVTPGSFSSRCRTLHFSLLSLQEVLVDAILQPSESPLNSNFHSPSSWPCPPSWWHSWTPWGFTPSHHLGTYRGCCPKTSPSGTPPAARWKPSGRPPHRDTTNGEENKASLQVVDGQAHKEESLRLK